MNDSDKTRKFKTICRCGPRDPVTETVTALRTAHAYAPAASIKQAIEQLLANLDQQQERAA